MNTDSSFEEQSRQRRENEELRKAAYAAAKTEVKFESKRNAALENLKMKSRNLHRPKYAVIKTWGDWFDENIILYMPDQIYDTIDISSMPRWANITLFAGFIFFALSIFIYFAYAGIDGAMQVKFISVSGNSTIQECQTVSAVVTGQFTADKHGRWSSDIDYKDNAAIYKVDFSATNVTEDEYTAVMNGFGSRLKDLGTRMDTADLAWILMAWTTVSYADTKSGIRLTTMASSDTVFGNSFPFYTSTFSYSGECYPEDGSSTPLKYPSPSLSQDFTQVTISYDMGSYVDYSTSSITDSDAFDQTSTKTWTDGFSPCEDQFSPEDTFGYVSYEFEASGYTDTTMDLTLDIRSMLLATSVNFGIMSLDDLMVVRDETRLFLRDLFNDVLPPFKFYTDPYANVEKRMMEPIACVPSGSEYPAGNTTEFPFCLVFSQYNFFYPAFWSKASYDTSSNNYCQCGSYANYGATKKDFCNGMYIEMLAVYDKKGIFAKVEEYETHMNNWGFSNQTWHAFELGAKYSWFMAANNMTGDVDIRSELQGVLTDDTGNIEQFETLCPGNKDGCGAVLMAFEPLIDVAPLTPLSMELGDLSSTTYTDQYGYAGKKQVTCINTIYDSLIFENMSATAPVSLVEAFYECSYTWNQAFINSVGNASASASLYTFFIMYVGIRIIVWLAQQQVTEEIENPRVKDYHSGKGDDNDRKIVHAALKRIITLGKADVLDPAFVELFKEDFDGDLDLTRASLSAAAAGAIKRSSLDSHASKGSKATRDENRLRTIGEESKV